FHREGEAPGRARRLHFGRRIDGGGAYRQHAADGAVLVHPGEAAEAPQVQGTVLVGEGNVIGRRCAWAYRQGGRRHLDRDSGRRDDLGRIGSAVLADVRHATRNRPGAGKSRDGDRWLVEIHGLERMIGCCQRVAAHRVHRGRGRTAGEGIVFVGRHVVDETGVVCRVRGDVAAAEIEGYRRALAVLLVDVL